MKIYAENCDLICCKKSKNGKTYGKLYEGGKLYDFVSLEDVEDIKNINAVFDFRYGEKDGKVWTMLTLKEWKEN